MTAIQPSFLSFKQLAPSRPDLTYPGDLFDRAYVRAVRCIELVAGQGATNVKAEIDTNLSST